MDTLYRDYIHVVLFLAVMGIVVWAPLFLGALIRPKFPFREKNAVYECGEPTIGSPWVRYNMRFYTAALIFLLFDVEMIFLIPVLLWLAPAAQGKVPGATTALAWLIFLEILFFVFVLVVGLIYAWRTGGLEWVRGLDESETGGEAHTPTILVPTNAP